MTGETADLRETLDYDSERNEYHAHFDSDVRSPSTAVVSVIAAITDSDPVELDPLHGAIDPEALDRLCATAASGPGNSDSTVEFTYLGYGIRVESYGTITAWPLSDSEGDAGE